MVLVDFEVWMIPACVRDMCYLTRSCAGEGNVSPSVCLWRGCMYVGLGSVSILGKSHPPILTETAVPGRFRA